MNVSLSSILNALPCGNHVTAWANSGIVSASSSIAYSLIGNSDFDLLGEIELEAALLLLIPSSASEAVILLLLMVVISLLFGAWMVG